MDNNINMKEEVCKINVSVQRDGKITIEGRWPQNHSMVMDVMAKATNQISDVLLKPYQNPSNIVVPEMRPILTRKK